MLDQKRVTPLIARVRYKLSFEALLLNRIPTIGKLCYSNDKAILEYFFQFRLSSESRIAFT